jgi:hypothetical protein
MAVSTANAPQRKVLFTLRGPSTPLQCTKRNVTVTVTFKPRLNKLSGVSPRALDKHTARLQNCPDVSQATAKPQRIMCQPR